MAPKNVKPAVLAALLAIYVTACGNNANETSIGNEISENKNEAVQTEVELPQNDMMGRSLTSFGNTYRMMNKINKAKSGEKVTVAYIGGSITEGIGGTPDTCYAKLSCNRFAELFGTGDNIVYINAGVSGTPSILGNLRVKKDVLDLNADIVFIEFAVNDGMETIYKESFESLVRTVLEHENQPAVVLLFTVTQSGHTCQEQMKQVGEYYQLPMISVPDAILPEIGAGNMTWQDYCDDGVHPNAEGHRLVADFIGNYFGLLPQQSEIYTEYNIPERSLWGAPYKNAILAETDYKNGNDSLQILDLGSFSPKNKKIADFEKGAWVWSGDSTEPMKIRAKGNCLFFVCKRNNNAGMGKFDVLIDGKKAGTINTNQPDGWGEPYAFSTVKLSAVREMEAEIVPAEDSAGKTIEIYAIAVTQNETEGFY